jgi:hypothetical protein
MDEHLTSGVGRARGSFSTVPRATGAPDRVLPRAYCLFGLEGASAHFWGRLLYTNLGPEPKIRAGCILGDVLGALVEMLLGVVKVKFFVN